MKGPNVIEAILAFDGKRVEDLKLAVAGYSTAEAETLARFCKAEDPQHRVAATWIVLGLLKRDQNPGFDLDQFFAGLTGETEWEVLLHLLQSVQHAPEPAFAYSQTIDALLKHKKTLVAVWALDARVRVALVSGEPLERIRDKVDQAMNGNKASLRARARKLAPLVGL